MRYFTLRAACIFFTVAQMLAKCSFNLLQLLHGKAQGGARRLLEMEMG